MALQIEEIGDLVARGARRVQLDSLGYNQVFDDEFRAATGNGAVDSAAHPGRVGGGRHGLVGAVEAADPGVTVGMHICRGNNRSA